MAICLITNNVHGDHWTKWYLPGFSTVQVLFSLIP